MAELRLFVAVLISDELKITISKVQEDFKKAANDVKWVAPGNFHVTVKFLGGVDEDRVDDIEDALAESVKGVGPFGVIIEGAGAFPGISRPQVIWIGMGEGVEPLRRLAEKVENGLQPLGFPKEDRKFKAHITIGRTKDLKSVGNLPAVIKNYETEVFGSLYVDRIALMKSDLRKEGPIYTVLREFELPGP